MQIRKKGELISPILLMLQEMLLLQTRDVFFQRQRIVDD